MTSEDQIRAALIEAGMCEATAQSAHVFHHNACSRAGMPGWYVLFRDGGSAVPLGFGLGDALARIKSSALLETEKEAK